MIKGLYTSAQGMMTQYKKMDVISNNLANVNTTGYKKDGVITETFPEVFISKLNDANETTSKRIGKVTLGSTVDKIYTNFMQGSLKETNNPLNLALDGNGFFVVNVEDKNGQKIERYTRDGSFVVSPDNILVTKDGYEIQGQNGPIRLSDVNNNININRNGQIFIDNVLVDKIKLVDFEDKSALRKVGNNLYKTFNKDVKSKDFSGNVVQGFLETSNVNTISQMVEMINVARVYETNQKVLQSNDQTLGKAVNDVGRL